MDRAGPHAQTTRLSELGKLVRHFPSPSPSVSCLQNVSRLYSVAVMAAMSRDFHLPPLFSLYRSNRQLASLETIAPKTVAKRHILYS